MVTHHTSCEFEALHCKTERATHQHEGEAVYCYPCQLEEERKEERWDIRGWGTNIQPNPLNTGGKHILCSLYECLARRQRLTKEPSRTSVPLVTSRGQCSSVFEWEERVHRWTCGSSPIGWAHWGHYNPSRGLLAEGESDRREGTSRAKSWSQASGVCVHVYIKECVYLCCLSLIICMCMSVCVRQERHWG